jgi:diguanylate cyclase (GGDEF)-like protein
LYTDELPIELVAGLAGDLELTAEERQHFRRLHARYGDKIYEDMLFVLTHQYFPEEKARYLWDKIVNHKNTLEKRLERSVGISVAAMDYLTNIDTVMDEPTVISKGKIAEIAEIALKDGLTQLFDVSTFQTKLETEIKRYRRYRSPVSVIMIDIDDFKQVNDSHGHGQGDRVLSEISKLMLRTARDLDICARYGGEEFAVILPQTGRREAVQLAERLRRRVETCFNDDLKVTLSLGVATCPQDAKSARALIRKADNALYQSKRDGKNRVTAFRTSSTALKPAPG